MEERHQPTKAATNKVLQSSEPIDPDEFESEDDSCQARRSKGASGRSKSGSGIAGRIISTLRMSANAIAGAANHTWTEAVRHNRVDFAEVCCTADSQLAGEVIAEGGAAERYSHWNGFDLTTRKGSEPIRDGLESTRTRCVWLSPPCGPDSPMQNLNQRTDEQSADLESKRSRSHRIQRNIREIVVWLQGTT